MGDPFEIEAARERQKELLREAEERRISRTLRRSRRGAEDGDKVEDDGVEVGWGFVGDEPAVADLLELNGIPRWVSFEERFVVARKDGKMLGAVSYRTESKRLILGQLVVDPWAGEGRIATELYRGAVKLARELGVREVFTSGSRAGYPGRAGYRRKGRGWRFDLSPYPRVHGGPLRGTFRA